MSPARTAGGAAEPREIKAKKIHDALVVCYNATPNEDLRELIALMEVMMILQTMGAL